MAVSQSRLYNFVNDKNASTPITASKVDAELNAQIAALNRKVIAASTAPSSPVDGDSWIDLSQDPPVMKIYDQTNAGWSTAPVTIASPAQGEIIYYNGTSWVVLGVGTDGQILETQGASKNPNWIDVAIPTDLAITSQAAGDIIYFDGTNWIRLAKGTAGQVIAINSGATAPEWVADPLIDSIKDYGTSASVSTSKNQAVLKICYGTLTVSGTSAALSNLPFTSATSYVITASFGTANSPTEAITAVNSSGSASTIYSTDNLSQAIHWIAIGT